MTDIHLKNFKENEVIIKEGDVSPALYRIKSGIVAFIMSYGTDEEYLIEVFSDESFFGEVGFFLGRKNSCSVVAQSDCVVEKIDKENLSLYLSKNPGIGIEIMKYMAKNNDALTKHLSLLSEELLDVVESKKTFPVDLKKKLLQYKGFYK